MARKLKKSNPPSRSNRVSIVLGGKIYMGRYTVRSNSLTVEYQLHRKRARLDGALPAVLARIMLREMVLSQD